jgi:hypothetical protein
MAGFSSVGKVWTLWGVCLRQDFACGFGVYGERMLSCIQRLRSAPGLTVCARCCFFVWMEVGPQWQATFPSVACVDDAVWMRQEAGRKKTPLGVAAHDQPAAYVEGPKKLAEDIAVPRALCIKPWRSLRPLGRSMASPF